MELRSKVRDSLHKNPFLPDIIIDGMCNLIRRLDQQGPVRHLLCRRVHPTCNWRAILLARLLLREKTVEPSPKGQSLASAMASASVWNLTMVKTGPKTSSLCTQGRAHRTRHRDTCDDYASGASASGPGTHAHNTLLCCTQVTRDTSSCPPGNKIPKQISKSSTRKDTHDIQELLQGKQADKTAYPRPLDRTSTVAGQQAHSTSRGCTHVCDAV